MTTEQPISELLPCPHCGEKEHLYPAYHELGVGKPYAIDCLGCGADYRPREGLDVVALWNRRAPAPVRVKPLEWGTYQVRNGANGRQIVKRGSTPFRAFFIERGADGWWVTEGLLGRDILGPYDTYKAARDAAQADYDQRIMAAVEPAAIHQDDDVQRCFICAEPFKLGDMVLPDRDEGLGHRACFGEDREGYHGEDGGPLRDDEEIPSGYAWEPDQQDHIGDADLSQVRQGGREDIPAVLEIPQPSITVSAEKPPDGSGSMIVINMESRPLSSRLVSFADSASPVLGGKHFAVFVFGDAVSPYPGGTRLTSQFEPFASFPGFFWVSVTPLRGLSRVALIAPVSKFGDALPLEAEIAQREIIEALAASSIFHEGINGHVGSHSQANEMVGRDAVIEECAQVVRALIPNIPHDGPTSEEHRIEYEALGSALLAIRSLKTGEAK